LKRKPIIERFSSTKRFFAQAISAGYASMPAARFDPNGMGSDGWERTGATTQGSVIIASAKPPVKHMPTAPTPFPPHSACALRANVRSHATIGLDLPADQTLNSRRIQIVDNSNHAV